MTIKTEPEKVTNMVGTFLTEDLTRRLFKRKIIYTYHQVVSGCIKESAAQVKPKKVTNTKADSKKVTNMVGTFLTENSARLLFKRAVGCTYQQVISEFVKVTATKTEQEKVTNMVGTFLNEDTTKAFFKRAIGCTYKQVISESVKVSATKTKLKKVVITVTTFLNKGTDIVRNIRVISKVKQFCKYHLNQQSINSK